MNPIFAPNDIVYFKKEYRSHYGSGYYLHFLNKPYKVLDWNNIFGLETGTIQNISDGVNHFVHSDMLKCLISEDEWKLQNRKNNLEELLNK